VPVHHDYEGVPELTQGLAEYFRFYREERPHQSLGCRTPAEVHAGKTKTAGEG
jgi:putative transposase